jgi:hypothetical protein
VALRARGSGVFSWPPALSRLEETLQHGEVWGVRLQLQGIDALGAKIADQAAAALQGLLFKSCADGGARGIDFDQFTGFRILEREHPDIGQLPFTGILDMDGNEVMTAIRLAHGPAQLRARGDRVANRLEIRYQEYDRTPMQDMIDNIERLDAVGAFANGHVIEDIPDGAQHVPAALSGRQIPFGPIGV